MSQKAKIIAQFAIPYFQFLNSHGSVVNELPAFAAQRDEMLALYRNMWLTRLFDKKAVALQRTGKLGTYPSPLGQEAIGAGIGAAMQQEDVFVPYYREYGAQFWRGVKMSEILLYWGGDERGSCFANKSKDFPLCVPIASQTLHAAGAAFALKIQNKQQAVVTTIGDGGTSRGDFYEAMNLAGVWDLPIVFVINNNQWAISVPLAKQTKAQTLAQKAIAAGIESCQVDGNDVIGVRTILEQALVRAREHNKPFVIEALSYRMHDHTTADDATRYRSTEELQQHQQRDPIIRLQKFLYQHDWWNEADEKSLQLELSEEVAQAVAEFEALSPPKPEDMFSYLYETLPSCYETQREELKRVNK